MIVMDLKIDNFCALKNFHINMSYPKKIVNSMIEGEFLKDRENFRYKKVNILMGANATGKTSIGQMLMAIFNFIERKEAGRLKEKVNNKSKEACFSMDFVVHSYKLYRINVKIVPSKDKEGDGEVKVCTRVVEINKKDSYESCAKKIEEESICMENDFISELEKIEHLGWMFAYPSDSISGAVKCSENANFPMILDYTLRALDSSIKKVEKLAKVDNTYIIRMDSQDLIIQDGEVIKNNILSSGTKSGIDVALMLSSIYAGECGFYYCDEKFSYIHTDIEKAFLSIMIEGLENNDQLFFTTHNTDILDMPLPKHTFSLLKKDINDDFQPIKCIDVSKYLKRNTDSLRNAVDNDLFSTTPNLEMIYKISELKNR
ncbi:hypothetical protein IMSAGC020_02027 [Lachnospiraceae bacterium]|nr:hypothetical protein IMSAGC020_02027 [Lachnospiraceae bacterium]